jgi:hypothetical protein
MTPKSATIIISSGSIKGKFSLRQNSKPRSYSRSAGEASDVLNLGIRLTVQLITQAALSQEKNTKYLCVMNPEARIYLVWKRKFLTPPGSQAPIVQPVSNLFGPLAKICFQNLYVR